MARVGSRVGQTVNICFWPRSLPRVSHPDHSNSTWFWKHCPCYEWCAITAVSRNSCVWTVVSLSTMSRLFTFELSRHPSPLNSLVIYNAPVSECLLYFGIDALVAQSLGALLGRRSRSETGPTRFPSLKLSMTSWLHIRNFLVPAYRLK